MINGYKGVMVFTAARSGSTLLVEQLTRILSRRYPTANVTNLYEILDTTQVYGQDWTSDWIDRKEIIPRPATNAADLWRLERVFKQANNSTMFAICKVFSNDITPHNWPLIRDQLIEDDGWYKISLMRMDVANMIYSAILGRAINRWERRDGDTKENLSAASYNAPKELYVSLGQAVMRNIDWCMFHSNSMDKIVWYDQLEDSTVDFTELGIASDDIISDRRTAGTLQKVNNRHELDISLHVVNHSEVIEFARGIEKNCINILQRLRNT